MSSVRTHRTDAVATITIDRPDRLNALDLPTRTALLEQLRAVAADDAIRAVVLTGAGRAFCSGQDLDAADELIDAGATVRDSYNPLPLAIRAMDKPVVAAINGLAVGAGLGLALACDVRVMSEKAFLACSFVRVGLVPDTGVTQALLTTVGHARAFELAATGRRITADEALALGLVNVIATPEALAEAAWARAAELAAGPALALALTKRLLVAAADRSPADVLALEADAQGVAGDGPEHSEGVAAFLARREPVYPPSPAVPDGFLRP
jgi:2-(1,2-epoxy-1,2-dihydrophenyl)acetyl-CoA isomerase